MKGILIIGLVCFIWISARSNSDILQPPQGQYKFKYLTIDQGLSNNNIRAICQDSSGFLWFGSLNGLNKYDGQSITTYLPEPGNENSISSYWINELAIDSRSNLWIGLRNGLDIYSSDYNKFSPFIHDDVTWDLDQVYGIDEDKTKKVWFGGTTGLYAYNLVNGELQHIPGLAIDSSGVFPDLIFKVFVDRYNDIWLSVLNHGVYVYKQSDSTFDIYQHDPANKTTISGNRVERFYEDSNGNIWIGTYNNGLNRFNRTDQTFVRYYPDSNNLFSYRVRAFFEDLHGDFFIGTRAGLYKYQKEKDRFFLYAAEDHEFSKLSQNSIQAGFIDNSYNLWIGTFSGGVNYTSLYNKPFVHYMAGRNNSYYLNGANIYAITEDKNGNLLIGGDNGLNYLNRQTHTFSYFTHDPGNANSLSFNDVKSLEWDKHDNLWIGTNRGGLNYYNIKNGKYTHYRQNSDHPKGISGDKIYSLLCDRNNDLWVIAAVNNDMASLQLDMLPSGQSEFIHLREKPYFGLAEDKSGNIYVGAANGFWIFKRKDSVFTFVPGKDDYIFETNVLNIDSKGHLWIGSKNGLVRYDIIDGKQISYSAKTGYPISEVFGILEDDSGNLWISTISGLIKLSNVINDTSGIRINVYDQYDGLQSKQFNFNSYFKCRSGEMVFGGVNGFNTFFPDQISENKKPVNVFLTNLRIYNVPVAINEKVNGKVILRKAITNTDEIILGPEHKIFTIEFASIYNKNPDDYAYKTKLTGLNDDWQYRKVGNNLVTYTNLMPGEYTFLLTAANNDGYWNERPLKLRIVIKPPIWKTWWFISCSIILLIVLISLIFYLRIRLIRQRNILLEETVEKRTAEIREKNIILEEKQEEILMQKEELEKHRNHLSELVDEQTKDLQNALEKAKESDALKSAFLQNISHEVRTPMNAIIGFSGLLKESNLSEEEQLRYINLVLSNSESLLKIIEEVLDLSLIESSQLIVNHEVFELNAVLDQLFSYYHLNCGQNIELRINNTLKHLNIKLLTDSVKFKQILTNLLENACKFTKKGFIEFGTYFSVDSICFYIKDTGKGIPEHELENVFNRFIKLEDNEGGWASGLGLGLAISKKITEVLGGHIAIESEEKKGSTFTLSFPKEKILANKSNAVDKKIGPEKKPDWKGKTIIIAEDIEENYLYINALLKGSGINIIWAKDGDEVIKIYNENPSIDLILMDIKMPILNGYDAAKKIKLLNPEQKIIAQTAFARPHEKGKFYDENFDHYLSKPIKKEELFKVVEEYL